MGNICKSCCGGDDGQNDNDGNNERTNLINGMNSRAQAIEPPAEYQRTSSVLKKNDEQSALNRILHKAASNVIDVAALDAHGMEQHEFSEKSKAYSQKLAAATVHLKNRSRKKELLPEGSVPVDRLASLPVLSSADLELIRNLSTNMEEAFKLFAVHHQEELIVNFSMT